MEPHGAFQVHGAVGRQRLLLLSVLLTVWCGAAVGLWVFWADCFDVPTSLAGKALRLLLSGTAALVLTGFMFGATVLLAGDRRYPGSKWRRTDRLYDVGIVAGLILAVALGGGSLILEWEFGIFYRDALGWTVILLSMVLTVLAAAVLSYRTLSGWRRPVTDSTRAALRRVHHDGASSP